MNDNSKNILEQIKKEGIKPRPRWQFILSHAGLFAALILAVLVGGLVMAVVFLKMGNLDWEFVTLMGERGLPKVFDVLPFLWMALLVIILLLAVVAFEKTEGGYKYNPIWIVVGTILVSTLLGGAIYAFDWAERLEGALRAGVPFYEAMEREREERFHLPEIGILPGRVILVESATRLDMEDLRDRQWKVELVPGAEGRVNLLMLKPGQMIFAIGEQAGPDFFRARDVRTKRGMTMKMKPGMMKMIKPALQRQPLPEPGIMGGKPSAGQ